MDLRKKYLLPISILVLIAIGLVWFLKPSKSAPEFHNAIKGADAVVIYSGQPAKWKYVGTYDKSDRVFKDIMSALALTTKQGNV